MNGKPSFIWRWIPWVAACLLSSLALAADRPNILWLTAEDICPNLGC